MRILVKFEKNAWKLEFERKVKISILFSIWCLPFSIIGRNCFDVIFVEIPKPTNEDNTLFRSNLYLLIHSRIFWSSKCVLFLNLLLILHHCVWLHRLAHHWRRIEWYYLLIHHLYYTKKIFIGDRKLNVTYIKLAPIERLNPSGNSWEYPMMKSQLDALSKFSI
jgi:hypothetical protein